MRQVLKFLVVGVLVTAIDFLVLTICTEVFGVDYLLSNCLAFSISVIVNYLLSMRYVFKSGRENGKLDFIAFLVMSVLGLGLNSLAMWMCVELFGVRYLYGKIAATIVVTIYNFISRKLFYEIIK